MPGLGRKAHPLPHRTISNVILGHRQLYRPQKALTVPIDGKKHHRALDLVTALGRKLYQLRLEFLLKLWSDEMISALVNHHQSKLAPEGGTWMNLHPLTRIRSPARKPVEIEKPAF